MIQALAFVAYPVSNIVQSRHFYEDILGLELTHEAPVPVRGAVVAFEVSDLDAEVVRLQKLGVRFRREITETPVCRFAFVLDPDGSEVILHHRKAAA